MRSNLRSPANDAPGRRDASTIRKDVIAMMVSAAAKLTPATLQKILGEKYGYGKKQIKTLIRDLISSGEITYTYEYGSTFLERSFNKPVRISKHVVLTPPGHQYDSKPTDAVIQIKPGASFGGGQHPSTRLAVRGIEYTLRDLQPIIFEPHHPVLDIGTGSGVLIITAVRFGMHKGLGIDIDPCARVEAVENVKLNGMQQQIKISDQTVDCIHQRFGMIIANLRYPSLKKLFPLLTAMSLPAVVWVFSGIRESESEHLKTMVTTKEFKCLWTETEQDWVGIVFQKVW
jgi:ribosomal protein L11 methyltransferase